MDSDDSQTDLFANTQIPTKNSHVNANNQWDTSNLEYPMVVLFLWNGQMNPFVLVDLTDLEPEDVDEKWLSGILSPVSRLKHRNMKMFPEFGVSLYAKIQKRK